MDDQGFDGGEFILGVGFTQTIQHAEALRKRELPPVWRGNWGCLVRFLRKMSRVIFFVSWMFDLRYSNH